MAAIGWEKFVVIYVLLLNHIFVSAEQPCELAKIHVQGENGNQQVLTMKQLKPTQCGTCRRGDEALSCGASVDAAASRYSARAVPRTLDLVPRVTLVFDEILIGCDRLTDEVSVELCARSKQYKKQAANAGSKAGKQQITKDLFQQYSKAIVENSLLPFMSHHKDTDLDVAYGVVLMSMGYADESVEHFTKLIKAKGRRGDNAVLYNARGISYARKGLPENGLLALADFSKAIDLDPTKADSYTKKAEIHLALGQYTESLANINKAIEIQPAGRLYFLKGTIEFAFDDLAGAELDFRQTLTEGAEEYRLEALYYLGLTLYYRGKVRNSIGTFKDAVQQKKDYIEAHTGLGQAYRELGDYNGALKNFNVTLCQDRNHLLTVRLRGSTHYHSGETLEALKDFNKCLSIDPNNMICRYMQGLSLSSLGRFYEGIKTQTKVIVYNNWPVMKMTPEFIKAHYLREYCRYLHRHLESPVSSVNPDRDLNGAFRDHWAKLLPFTFKEGYQEQPGLQPQIPDVAPSMFMNYRPEVHTLVCRARQLGGLTQVSVDGFLPNSRLNLAMGLAIIHIAQVMASVWQDGRTMKNGDQFNWRDMFDIAVQYRRLVDPEQAVFWLDSMPDENVKDGYTNDIHFIKGDTMNVRLIQYFELVFKLVKTMVDHYSGEGVFNYQEFKEDLEKVRSCEDLLNVAKSSQLNRQGFMVSTQVPSMKDKTVRYEGVILSLTGDLNGKLLFAINLATTKTRTTSYHAELDFMFNKLYQEIRKTGVNKIVDIDNILNTILTLVYYFYNLMPLTRGSSVAAYSVAMGLILSLGWEVQGKIPTGKLLDIEAMLSGAPDAFIMVLKQWINVKRSDKPLSAMTKVKDAFPTVRSVLELLSLSSQTITCTIN